MKRRRKSWRISPCTDMTVYNAKLAHKLHKIVQHAMRITKRYGLSYASLVVIGDYASVRAQEGEEDEEDGTTATTVVDDYLVTTQED